MEFVMLINLKLLANANSFLLKIAEHENFSANKYENANYCKYWTWRLVGAWRYVFGLARRGSTIGFHLLWHTVELAMSTRLCLL